jgi:serine/threonine protein kinase
MLISLCPVEDIVKFVRCSGADGHLKLCDFGLSKVVGFNAREPTQQQRDPCGLALVTLDRLQKLLPMKMDTTQREEQAEAATHRTVKVLLITMDDSKADSTLLFINTTVEVSIADYDIDSETIQLSQFEAIFIDGDYYEDDSVELVTHFCSRAFKGLPVLLCAKAEALRQRAVEAGARACSRLPLEVLIEETFDALFQPRTRNSFIDPLRAFRTDLVTWQEERAAQARAQQEQVLQVENGFAQITRYNDSKDQRPLQETSKSLTAVCQSHSLVGTLHFIAPEAIKQRRYGKTVDWWAVGMSIYECLVRKHLFQGEEKQAVFENIMNAPIVLDELAPSGEVVVGLVRGLLNRDIKRRLGSHGADAIKGHKLFEKIDWATVSTSNPVHKPAQFVSNKYSSVDKDLFYGRRGPADLAPRANIPGSSHATSMQRYQLNKRRNKSKNLLPGHSFSAPRFNRRLLSVRVDTVPSLCEAAGEDQSNVADPGSPLAGVGAIFI